MKILAVIPARGGSKGIPRKNVRLLAQKPLISYAVQNALNCEAIAAVVVTSDDDEVKSVARHFGATVLDRPDSLAGDTVTLDPVVHHAVAEMEARLGVRYDAVITMQPTSPLLAPQTLAAAVDYFAAGGFDTVLSVVNRPHLAWKEEGGRAVPNYKERLNRQQLPANYLETGAFFISRRDCVTEKSRFGQNVGVFETSEAEAIDIDSLNDWALCEAILGRKRIVIRTDGYPEIGMGHVYRGLSLAYALVLHAVTFVVSQKHLAGAQKIKEYNFKCVEIKQESDFYDFLEQEPQDIVVVDCLDTEAAYIRKLKTLAQRVITFEDMGSGTGQADAVVNALYDEVEGKLPGNIYAGERYVCLRNEFLMEEPAAFREDLREVLVVFGGSDPAGLTEKLHKAARHIVKSDPETHFTFILGAAKQWAGEVPSELPGIMVLRDVKDISTHMKKADLAFTSQGRTVYELASLGVPSVVLAQNEREQLHTFAQMPNGFLNLGLGSRVDDNTIVQTYEWLKNTPAIRREMRECMLRHDLRGGMARVVSLILER